MVGARWIQGTRAMFGSSLVKIKSEQSVLFPTTKLGWLVMLSPKIHYTVR